MNRMACLSAVLVALGPVSAAAISLCVEVVPNNVEKQPLTFSIQTQPRGNEEVWFEVTVSSADGSLSPSRDGHLTVWFDVATARAKRDVMGWRPNSSVSLASCGVAEVEQGESIRYSVTIHRRLLAQSTFLFSNCASQGGSSCRGYDIVLADFVKPGE